MRRFLLVFSAALFLCLSAHAQETPWWEIGGHYSHLVADTSGVKMHLDGGGGSLSENMNGWFGGRFEFNAYRGTEAGRNVNVQTINFGPVFSYRRSDRFTPFAHAQFGAIHASSGYLGISESASKFAVTPGLGVDLKVSRTTAIRAQGDYMASYFLNQRQNNFQISVGLVLRIWQK